MNSIPLLILLLLPMEVWARRSFESTASDGSTVRTTGNFFEQSITGQKMLYDFGANDLQKQTAQYDILAVNSQIKNIQSELLLEALEAFYEVQRSLLQSRLAREFTSKKNICKFH